MSSEFKQLSKRIAFLETSLLPIEKPNGNYTRREEDLIKAYILLVHAEIEAFLETIAENKMQAALGKWENANRSSICLTSVLSFCPVNENFAKKNKNDKDNLTKRIKHSISIFFQILVKNNGIKRDNILKILLPLGISIDDLDVTWLNTMESFGSSRGYIAHKSFKVNNQIDPKTEKDKINKQILPELRNIYELVKKLK